MSQSATPPHPNLLLELVLIFLTPMFLYVSDGDLPRARQAAVDTLNAFGARSLLGMVIAAKIIAYEFATLASLSQSMTDDISPQLALRFRSNATSLDRSAERNRQLLEQQRIPAGAEHLTEERAAASVAEAQKRVQQAAASLQASHAAEPAPAPPIRPAPATEPPAQPDAAARPPAQPATQAMPPAQPTAATALLPARPTTATVPPARMSEEQRRTAWAQAMTSVAAEFTAGLDRLPPAERAKEMLRISALTESASALVAGIAPSGHPGNPLPAGLAAPAGAP